MFGRSAVPLQLPLPPGWHYECILGTQSIRSTGSRNAGSPTLLLPSILPHADKGVHQNAILSVTVGARLGVCLRDPRREAHQLITPARYRSKDCRKTPGESRDSSRGASLAPCQFLHSIIRIGLQSMGVCEKDVPPVSRLYLAIDARIPAV